MMHAENPRERDVERRLGGLESPEPPAELLDRIRGDIPDYLQPVEARDDRAPRRRRRYRLAAASLLLAVAGGLLAYRVLRQAPAELQPGALRQPPPVASSSAGVDPDRRRLEVGPAQVAPPQPETPPGDTTAAVSLEVEPAPPAERSGEDGAKERLAGALKSAPAAAPLADREPPRGARPALTEVGPAAEREGRRDGDPSRPEPQAPLQVAEKIVVESSPFEPSDPPRVHGATAEIADSSARPTLDPRRRLQAAPPPPPSVPSTGGTAEPNDQPWGDMFFRPYGTNPFVDTEDDRLSTFGLDVDTGSYTLARSYLERGHLPPREAIRVEEFLNYFDYRDPPPRRGEFTLTAEGAPSPWPRGPRYQLLRIGLRAREVAAAQRRDATLIFVIDVSGSMARDDRLGLVRRALDLLLGQLGPGDRVGLVVYGSHGRVLLEPTRDLEAVRRAIGRLTPGGSTNAEEGLVLAYEMARRHHRPEAIHRLVLCSDGVANVGRTGPESILERVGREAGDGIELTTVGFGMGNYNDVLMEQLADRGDGNYAYVDSLEEARRVFVENLTGTLQTIASDAKIQVEFDPRSVARYRLLGYENRDVADHRFRDDSVDAGELGAGHRVTALYEIKLADDAPRRGRLAEVRLRYRSQATGQVVEDALAVRRPELAREWRQASPSLRLAALAAELAELLKRSYWAREIEPGELRERARAVARDFPGDRDVAELVRLSERAADLVAASAEPWE